MNQSGDAVWKIRNEMLKPCIFVVEGSCGSRAFTTWILLLEEIDGKTIQSTVHVLTSRTDDEVPIGAPGRHGM